MVIASDLSKFQLSLLISPKKKNLKKNNKKQMSTPAPNHKQNHTIT